MVVRSFILALTVILLSCSSNQTDEFFTSNTLP